MEGREKDLEMYDVHVVRLDVSDLRPWVFMARRVY